MVTESKGMPVLRADKTEKVTRHVHRNKLPTALHRTDSKNKAERPSLTR
jgi:hypothetical protein